MPLPDLLSLRRSMKITLFTLGILLSVAACGLLIAHTRSFSLKRDTAVMIGTTLPELRSTVSLLKANQEAEQHFFRSALSAREEQASVYILPAGPAASRAVSVLQSIARVLRETGESQGSIDALSFQEKASDHGDYKTVSATLKMTSDFRFVARFLSILALSGDMMIRDVFSDEASSTFLRQVNESAPLSLKAAEDFLYGDLLTYAAEPDQVEQAMLQDIPEEMQPDIRAFVLASGLADVRRSLSDIAPNLKKERIWPLPFLTVDSLQRDGEKWQIGLTFYRR
ncbi:hypothetical protein EXS65_00250 [Candidatus Peribacteria bacterium]|nr:hypothetical protein [Candidatus Peribacteria bacterium]